MNLDNLEFLSEKEKQVFKLKEEGKTYKEISLIFDRSPCRIGQIYVKIKRKMQRHLSESPQNILKSMYWGEHDCRIRNCLVGADINTIQELIAYSFKDLLQLRNLGSQSIIAINNKLKELGYSLKGRKQ